MRRTAVEKVTSGFVVEQGLDLAAQVGSTATEAVRSRREPAQIARRRQRAARRRRRSWSAATVGTVAVGAGLVAVNGGLAAPVIVALVVLALVLALCVVRGVRAAGDLRVRNREVAALPPPSPRRAAVVGELRPAMARLDGYSDGLRRLVTMIGLVEDDRVRAVRGEVIAAADSTEQRLRDRAAEASALIRTRRRAAAEVGGNLDATVGALRQEIEDGVAAYGRLVAAANEAAHATRTLASGGALASGDAHGLVEPGLGDAVITGRPIAGPASVRPARAVSGPVPPTQTTADPAAPTMRAAPELVEPIDQLRSLAAGMRELTR